MTECGSLFDRLGPASYKLLRMNTAMRKVGLLLAALVLAYAAYPYWSLYRLGEALKVGDESALKHYVDWSAVRSGLKEDFSGMLSRNTGRAIGAGESEAAIGGLIASAIAGALLDAVVDALVTPEGLAAMIREGRAREGAPVPDGHSGQRPRVHEALREHLSFAFFSGPGTFEAVFETEKGDQVVAVMQLNGMRWQLVRLRLPDDPANWDLDLSHENSDMPAAEHQVERDAQAMDRQIKRDMPPVERSMQRFLDHLSRQSQPKP